MERLLGIVEPYLPQQDWFYDGEALTDRSERFLASELIREKLFRLTGDELPYTSTVVIDKFEQEGRLSRIAASIVVERDAHKGMVIGDKGALLKRIGSEARQELETLARRQGLPRTVGQGAQWLGRRRGSPAQLRLRVRCAARCESGRSPADAAAGRIEMPAVRRPSATLSAFVLHQYDWSESSLIVDLFTREQGRLVVVAKGAKRPYSQLRSVLLPFNRIQVGLGEPTRRRRATTRPRPRCRRCARPSGPAGPACRPGAALFSGFYLNELLIKLLARSDPHPMLFDAYAPTLPALGASDAASDRRATACAKPSPPYARAQLRDEPRGQAALRAFELRLLQQIGLLPDLSLVTATQQPVLASGRYRLAPDAGIVRCGRRCGPDRYRARRGPGRPGARQHGRAAAGMRCCAAGLARRVARHASIPPRRLGAAHPPPDARTAVARMNFRAADGCAADPRDALDDSE